MAATRRVAWQGCRDSCSCSTRPIGRRSSAISDGLRPAAERDPPRSPTSHRPCSRRRRDPRPATGPSWTDCGAHWRSDRAYIANLEATERERTGIRSLKVGFNKVFGYYIEISHANREPVPADYIRKQTLVNAERYITPDLKEAEGRVLAAEERISAAEQDAYRRSCWSGRRRGRTVRAAARRRSRRIDALAGLAEVAATRGYVRPELDDGDSCAIVDGRHPVVERQLHARRVRANDTRSRDDDGRIAILTGPNMAGKTTYLRQVALIVLLAQIGSFVPAERAPGSAWSTASSPASARRTTSPAANRPSWSRCWRRPHILHHATPRSLVVLDEIGRGTSTYDGLAIARAIVEYLHNTPRLECENAVRHPLPRADRAGRHPARRPQLPRRRAGDGDSVIFLHRVVPGGADRSYGIHVAQLAGMPRGVVRRATDILADLERDSAASGSAAQKRSAITAQSSGPMQMALFGGNHPAIERLSSIEVDALSPLEALTALYELQRLVKDNR